MSNFRGGGLLTSALIASAMMAAPACFDATASPSQDTPTIQSQSNSEAHYGGTIHLDPPAASDKPAVSAQQALTNCYADPACHHPRPGDGGQPVERLVRYTDETHFQIQSDGSKTPDIVHRLVWAVIWPNGPCIAIGGTRSGTPLYARCEYVTAIDAVTGKYVQTTTESR